MIRPVARAAALACTVGCIPAAAPLVAAQNRGQVFQQFPADSRPIFLSGKVVLDDGTPPPDPVEIVRACEGSAPTPQGVTDRQGRFRIEVGRTPPAIMDAQRAAPFAWRGSLSEPSLRAGYDPPDLEGCELRVVAAGFSSDPVDISGQRPIENADVGTIVLRRLNGVRGSIFSVTTQRAPQNARKALENGRARARSQKYHEAVREYEKAVRAEPRFAVAWFELGFVNQVLNRTEDAQEAYRRAAEADPEFVKPYRQLAFLSFSAQKWQEVLEATERLLGLDPVSYPDGYYFDAVAHFYLRELEEAEASARKVISMDGERPIPRARAVLGAILIEKRDYAGAAEQLREYIELAASGVEVDQARTMLGQLEARLPPPTARRSQ